MGVVAYRGRWPQVEVGVFIASTASVIGEVHLATDANIWFGAVLRGDVGRIVVGQRTNVQDLTMVHMTGGQSETILGDDVTVGHGAILHGCSVAARSLIGMGSLLLDNVQVGEDCLIGAGSLLPPGMVVPPRSFVLGRPARVLRATTDEEVRGAVLRAAHYVELARDYVNENQPPPTK